MSTLREVPWEIQERLRAVALSLPEAHEQQAWRGLRWRIRQHTFAHALWIEEGRPEAYARAAGSQGPLLVLTCRLPKDELDALEASTPFVAGPQGRGAARYFRARFATELAGVVLDEDTDWEEIGEMLTESYCELAPRPLAAQVLQDLDQRP